MALATNNVPGELEVVMTANGAISDGQLVYAFTTARTVARSTASTTRSIGIAQSDAANGEQVTVRLFKPMLRVKVATTINPGVELQASATAGVAAAFTTGDKIGVTAETSANGDAVLFYPY
jgi:predicted transcriptional regulator